MKKKYLRPLIVIIISVFIFNISTCYLNKKSAEEVLSYKFKGVIESISYDQKKLPIIKVNGVEYYLYNDWLKMYDHFEVGDSILKEPGSHTVKIYSIKEKEYKIYD